MEISIIFLWIHWNRESVMETQNVNCRDETLRVSILFHCLPHLLFILTALFWKYSPSFPFPAWIVTYNFLTAKSISLWLICSTEKNFNHPHFTSVYCSVLCLMSTQVFQSLLSSVTQILPLFSTFLCTTYNLVH